MPSGHRTVAEPTGLVPPEGRGQTPALARVHSSERAQIGEKRGLERHALSQGLHVFSPSSGFLLIGPVSAPMRWATTAYFLNL
jgi:hypothetical protein